MKKLLIGVFTILSISQTVFGQNADKITYKGGELYMISQDANTKEEIFNIPIGKVLSISYDKFYKSYNIIYNYQDEGVTYMKFTYLKDLENGTTLMQEESYGTFGVLDKIKEIGSLIMVGTKVVESESVKSIIIFKITKING